MKNKKILVVCQHFWPENFRINEICYEFINKNYNVEVLCGLPNYPGGQYFLGYGFFGKRNEVHNNIKIKRCYELNRGNNSNIRISLNYLTYFLSSLFKLPYLLTQKYDRILIYQLSPVTMAFIGVLLSKKKKIPSVMYVLDVWPENLYSVINFKNNFIRKLLMNISNWHYKNVDKLITISNESKKLLQNRVGISDDKITFIPQCCEKIYEEEILVPELVNRFSDTFNIIFTGNISPAQSFETIIEAAKLLKNDNITNIRWIIVGDGMSLNWLKETVNKENLTPYFIFEGHKPITTIPAYTYIADGLIACLNKLACIGFAIPAKVMSYFAAGRPLILAMDSEIVEIVNDSNFGYACGSEDVNSLYNNIRKLYNTTKEERLLIGRRVKEYHYANFEWNMNFNKLENFIFGV